MVVRISLTTGLDNYPEYSSCCTIDSPVEHHEQLSKLQVLMLTLLSVSAPTLPVSRIVAAFQSLMTTLSAGQVSISTTRVLSMMARWMIAQTGVPPLQFMIRRFYGATTICSRGRRRPPQLCPKPTRGGLGRYPKIMIMIGWQARAYKRFRPWPGQIDSFSHMITKSEGEHMNYGEIHCFHIG